MMQRTFWVLTLTGLTVLASAGDAFAQRRGYGGGGRYSPYGYNNSYYGNRYYGNSYYGGRGYSPYYQGYGLGYSTGDYQPYYGARIIVNSDYSNSPRYVVGPASETNSAPATQSFYSGPGAAQRSAQVKVMVPTDDAQVWFDNTATKQRGGQRLFESAPLEPSTNYSYAIKARWLENGQTVNRERVVVFQAGQSLTIDFREDARDNAPARLPNTSPRN